MLSNIIPPCASFVELTSDFPGAALLPAEALALGSVSQKRLTEFTMGRFCARRALAAIGIQEQPILFDEHRRPLWPKGVVGSITHCRAYAAAAVAMQTDIRSIGIDAEGHAPLSNDLLRIIATDEDRRMLEALPKGNGVFWECILFSAKESVFKAWFPSTESWLGFEDVDVSIDPRAGTFEAHLSHNGDMISGSQGLYAVTGHRVFTSFVLR
jgi:4'-phosphopantetheinyl transferase EntD